MANSFRDDLQRELRSTGKQNLLTHVYSMRRAKEIVAIVDQDDGKLHVYYAAVID